MGLDTHHQRSDRGWFDACIRVQEKQQLPFCDTRSLVTARGIADICGVFDQGDVWIVAVNRINGIRQTGIINDNQLKVCCVCT